MTCMKYVRKTFLDGTFMCAPSFLLSRPECVCTCTQLRGYIGCGSGFENLGESQVLKVQQTEAHSTELRVSSPEFLFDMEHTQIILFLKGNHFGKCSKLRGQPLQRHASVWWRCVQMAHGEDLDRLNGGSESSVHFVWGRRTKQDRLEQGPANNSIPMQPSYILFAA